MKFRIVQVRSFVVIIGLLLGFTATLVWAAPIPYLNPLRAAPTPAGFDPLSQAEQDLVIDIARQSPAMAAQLNGPERTELLLVERHQESKQATRLGQWPRRADIYLYNYDTDTLTRSIINLERRTVDDMESAQEIQLPLTDREIEAAIQLALADPDFRRLLETQFRTITAQPLNDPEVQLTIRPMIFRAEAVPDRALGEAAACGLHRCAQLLLITREDTLVNLLPVVDLSRQTLVSVNAFLTE